MIYKLFNEFCSEMDKLISNYKNELYELNDISMKYKANSDLLKNEVKST